MKVYGDSEWLAARRDYVMATDSAAIAGRDPWRGPFTVYCEKRGLIPPTVANKRMRWGARLEDDVLEGYSEETARAIVPPNLWPAMLEEQCEVIALDHFGTARTIVISREHPIMAATPDGFLERWLPLPDLDEQTELAGVGVLEAKTAEQFAAAKWDQVKPIQYRFQVQHTAHVTSAEWAAFAVLGGDFSLRCFDERADRVFGEKLVRMVERFWNGHVVPGIPPAPSAAESERNVIDRLWPEVDGTTKVLGAEFLALHAERERRLALRRENEPSLEAINNRIRLALAGAEAGQIFGSAITYYLTETRQLKFFERRHARRR